MALIEGGVVGGVELCGKMRNGAEICGDVRKDADEVEWVRPANRRWERADRREAKAKLFISVFHGFRWRYCQSGLVKLRLTCV